LAACGLVWLLVPRAAAGARLPIRAYTAEDGLAGDQITGILQDARGFVWIAAETGLSRFDGARFTSFDERDGIPAGLVSSLAETVDGGLWLATYGGVARLKERHDTATGAFDAVPMDLGAAGYRPRLRADPAGGLWLTGPQGLYRTDDLARPEFRVVPLAAVPAPVQISALDVGGDGSVWMGTDYGLLRRLADGRSVLYVGPSGAPFPGIRALLCDRSGRVWIGTMGGLFVLRLEPGSATTGEKPLADRAQRELRTVERFGHENGLPADSVTSLTATPDGGVWVTASGVVQFVDGRPARTIGPQQGLTETSLTWAFEDHDRNLWLGTEASGLMRIAAGGFVSYGEADGLVTDRIASVYEDQESLWVLTGSAQLHRFTGERFLPMSPPDLAHAPNPTWGSHQLAVHDRDGEWWLPTSDGLLRYAAGADLPRAKPKAIYRKGSGLPGSDIHHLWEDAAGDVWISILSPPPLVRWLRREQRFVEVPEVNARVSTFGAPTAFAEAADGDLWLGFFGGGLARRQHDRWSFYGSDAGVPNGLIWDLHFDHRGRLWIASSRGGAGRIDLPGSPTPRIEPVGGLASRGVDCITEDRQGRMYFGTRHGVDRLDPGTGNVRRFTTQDGLPSSRVHVCNQTRDGRLWFGTLHGLATFDPALVPPVTPRPVWLSALSAGGVPQPLAQNGASQVDGLVLSPEASSLRVEFVAVSHAAGEQVLYQHKLEGADDRWSEATAERAVEYARLAAGTYRFLVRAVGAENTVGEAAAVGFRVPPPIWRRSWFLSAAALLLAAAVWSWHRQRMARVIAVERVRTRIASDLHDDVGSSLSQIALLADLGRMSDAPQALAQIGDDARTLIDATSDIVWAIDPRRDDLRSLLVRLRRFAADLLEARGIRLDFELPDNADRIELEPELRRELYLLLKEAVHNVAKHSQAHRAQVRLEIVAGALRIEVADDGVGFAPGEGDDAGRGLHSLRDRATRLGGRLSIETAPGAGTRLHLEVPR
jgi:signal transduction histidine kinase/ligand-binding sensor domain-containing protein